MMLQTKLLNPAADFLGTLREHGASQSRTRRTSFGTNKTTASRLRARLFRIRRLDVLIHGVPCVLS